MKLKIKKMLFICLLFLAFIIFNGKTSFCYETNEFGFKHDGTDEVSFNRSTMELTVNGKIYKISFDLPEDYTNFAVVRASATLNDNYGVLFLPASAEKLILPVYSSDIKNYCNDFTIYYFARPNYMTSFPKNYSMAYFNACFFSTIDVYQAGSLICAGTKVTPKINPILYIDDQNLRKRFKFEFEIPLRDENTKYYVFLQKYTRNSYDSVTATFSIYTVDTPEGYDATNYENYMYYDLPSKKLYLPAGTNVKWYSTTVNNGKKAELGLISDFVAKRKSEQLYNTSYTLGFLKNVSDKLALISSLDYLFPTDTEIENFIANDVIYRLLFSTDFSTETNPKFKISIGDLLEYFGIPNISDFIYQKVLFSFYYADENYLFLPFEDFAFSNYTIVSYENSRHENIRSCLYYNLYRKTKVYNQENKIDDNTFAFNYSDGQDVSSLLPSDVDKGYLTSPWYKDNESSSSKGNITYDIREVIQGDKLIDYSKTDNSIHNNFYGDYIENFEEGDNITINNYYTQVIDKTSDNNLLHNIYIEVLEIKTLLASMGDEVSNTTNNFTYNIENNISYFLIPSKVYIRQNLSEINNTAKKNLGIIYEPVEFLIYTVTLFSKIDSNDEIVLNIPNIEYKGVYLINATTINLTSQMENLPILKTMHNIYLTCVDFAILGLLIAYATKVSKEVFNK